ncbi:TonB-dependent receptor plug domain-containing protein, partial [Klebsiella pneumoniae]|uniref:TonB-dependent receptor plug domain-containing protein n=1 Tax=Klebsiella pneumoniae TaxID=573 RepID=UPI0039C1D3C0
PPAGDMARHGGLGQSASRDGRGPEARHVRVLIDGVPMARPGIYIGVAFSQITISLVKRVEFIRGPRSAVYGSGSMGGVVI